MAGLRITTHSRYLRTGARAGRDPWEAGTLEWATASPPDNYNFPHLPVVSSRGYNYAEVTAGGVALPEVSPATMESRIVRGLYLVGEILDVDGRIGGFNFQWAWSTARVAATALARRRPPDAALAYSATFFFFARFAGVLLGAG